MKKITRLFISITLLISVVATTNRAFAGDVDSTKAREVGAYFLSAQVGDKTIKPEKLSLVYTIQNVVRDIPALYVFNTSNKRGFVIVAGTDCMDPIIGYNTEGYFDPNDIPDNMQWWINQYVDYVAYAQNNALEPSKKAREEWSKLEEKRLPYFGTESKAVITLLTTKWDQDVPYNAWSPMISGRRSYAGCVATALGQILRFWRYPVQPKGTSSYYWRSGNDYLRVKYDTVTFNYNNMPDILTSSSPDSLIRETARFLYYVGLGVQMNFSPNGSGAYSPRVVSACNNYFKYDGTSQYLERDVSYPNNTGTVNSRDSAWVNLLREEILARRPVYYDGTDPQGSGRDAAGHAFVCDGYNTQNDKFRFNFGWGNNSANYIWFNVHLKDLDVTNSGGYNFSTGHGMVIHLQPPADSIQSEVAIDVVENPFIGSIYPNPANEKVTVNFMLNDGEAAMLEVLDVTGRMVRSFKVQSSDDRITFSVADLKPGLYFCRLKGHTTKFIVQ